jgi:hypothetical protein
VNEGDQTPEGGPTDDPGPFGEILALGLPDATAPAEMSSAPTATSAPTYEPSVPKSHRRSLIIGVIGAVVFAALVIAAIFIVSATSAAISAGSGTATISWVSAPGSGDTSGNPPQSFSGTINGHSLSGVATLAIPAGSNPLSDTTGPPKDVQIFRYKGSFAGKPFDIGLFIRLPVSAVSTSGEAFAIEGTYDGQAVHAVIGETANPSLSNPPIPFSGTIGKWRVLGFIHGSTGTGQKQTATATFTVSS